MIQDHIKSVAKYVRDLLDYDESLIKFDRTMTQQDDVDTGYIVINSSQQADTLSTGQSYNGDAETMNYNATMSQPITVEFYGEDAYTNSKTFLLMSRSQKAKDLLRVLGITIYNTSKATDVKQILGSQYGNRVHVDFNITYTPNIDVSTLRIDTTVIEVTEDR